MALRRFIYVFILPFFAFLLSTAECSAVSVHGKEGAAACNIGKGSATDVSGQNVLSLILKTFDEGTLITVEHSSNSSAQVQARERDIPLCIINARNWLLRSSSLHFFIRPIRDELHTFIPIVRLLVFPKHWFW